MNMQVGSKLLITVGNLEKIIDGFEVSSQEHILVKLGAQLEEPEERDERETMEDTSLLEDSFSGGALGCMTERMLAMRTQMKRASALGNMYRDSSEGASGGKSRARLRLLKHARETFVQCYLNVTPLLNSEDGLVCIALSYAMKGVSVTDRTIKNIYVAPQDIRMPYNDTQWDDAASYVVL